MREFTTALELRPDFVSAQFNLGSALASMGRYDEAIEQFQHVLKVRPDFVEARRNLEACQRLQKQSVK